MRDDLGITIKLENGKAYLEFALPETMGRLLSALRIEIWEEAEGGRLIFHGEYSPEEADSMTALLLRPHLWDGMRDPYVYLVRAQGRFGAAEYGERAGVTVEEETVDVNVIDEVTEVYWQQELAIYDVRVIDKKGIFLNEKEFLPHEASYRLPPQISDAGTQEEQMKRDLERLTRMGVNVIRLEGEGTAAGHSREIRSVREFYRLCRKRGFLTGDLWIKPENLPVYRGLPGETSKEVLLSGDGRTLTERYYYYQAKWSNVPVLYPALSTLRLQENGQASLTIYSNQKKVVLYVDGVLFLFQSANPGDPEYIFEDIPVAKLPLHLAAEAGNLSISLTVTKI